MNTLNYLFASLVLVASCSTKPSMREIGNDVFDLAVSQFELLASQLPDDATARSAENGKIVSAPIKWWCSGFFPGSLAYTYAWTGNNKMRDLAIAQSAKLDSLFCGRYKTSHDVGFMTMCSYGKLREFGITDTIPALLPAAVEKLAGRFSPITGTTQSWDSRRGWLWPVIIDNMMNLELLMEYGSTDQQKMALSHADRTIENHFRPDYTTWHVVDYDPADGSIRGKQTHQGYSDASAWARGQAWALYGYTMMSREAAKKGFSDNAARYLSQAENIAKMLFAKLPSDGIPAWDFDAPVLAPAGSPEATLKDASAAAIMASAFVELSALTADKRLSRRCHKMAETQIRTLASPEYLSAKGENCGFLIKHCVGNLPGNSEIDVPLSYADYYFLEALYRINN